MADIESLPEPQRTTFLKRAKHMNKYTTLQHKALLYYYEAAQATREILQRTDAVIEETQN